MNILDVRDILIKRSEVMIVKGLSFQIAKGEILAIIGGNGAGKTTLLHGISGFIPIESGKIGFIGHEIQNISYDRIVEMGLIQVPEGRRIFPEMSVQENLILGSIKKEAKLKRQETMRLVYEILPVLSERKNQLAGTLSGGEQQMLAIGRGLMGLPKLFALDELSLGLAPLIQSHLLKIISELRSKIEIAILLVEQNTKQALKIADRACVMENGKFIISGPSHEVLKDEEVKRAYLGI
jgi:branched-chain amino acid transport system ATP-binding protein